MHHRRNERIPQRGKERYSTTDTHILGAVLVPPFPKYAGEIRNQQAGTCVMLQTIIYKGRK